MQDILHMPGEVTITEGITTIVATIITTPGVTHMYTTQHIMHLLMLVIMNTPIAEDIIITEKRQM